MTDKNSTDDPQGSDYEVGYGKPPKHTQFQPGQSGNKSGRPKNSKNLKSDLLAELCETILVREGGNQKKISKQRAMLKATMAKALSGDIRAVALLIGLIEKLMPDLNSIESDTELPSDDQEILDRFFETKGQRDQTRSEDDE